MKQPGVERVRDLYCVDDARQRLGGIARATIYEMFRTGAIATVVIGRRRFVPAVAIDRFIDQSSGRDIPRSRRRRDCEAA